MDFHIVLSKNGERGLRFGGSSLGEVDAVIKAHKDAFVSAERAHALGAKPRTVVNSYEKRFHAHRLGNVSLFSSEEPYQTYDNMGFGRRR